MYFWCICGEEGDLHVLLFHHLEAPPLCLFSYCWVLRVLFIFWITVHILSDVYFAYIFSQSMAWLLILLALSFTEHKYLILMKSRYQLFLLQIVTFVLYLKPLPFQWSCRFLPVLSSRSFIVLHFTFRSLIHFELMFLKGVSYVSRFVYLHVDVHCSSTISWRDYLCSILLPLLLCQISVAYSQPSVLGSSATVDSTNHRLKMSYFFLSDLYAI